MELRVLEYFLAVAGSRASPGRRNFCTSPSPPCPGSSRSWSRNWASSCWSGQRKVTLTEAGSFFRETGGRNCQSGGRTQSEMKYAGNTIAGDIYIGTGESSSIRNILRVARQLQQNYPDLHFH